MSGNGIKCAVQWLLLPFVIQNFVECEFPQPPTVRINHAQVRKWAANLSKTLTDFADEHMDFSKLKAEYTKQAKGQADEADRGRSIQKEVIDDIETLLTDKRTAVQNLVAEAQRLYKNFSFDPLLEEYYLNSKLLLSQTDIAAINSSHNDNVVEMARHARSLDLQKDSSFSYIPVNHEYSTVHVPTNVYDRFPKILNGAKWSSQLDETFIENRKRYPSLKWQYFCSTDGFFRVFPGLKWPRDNTEETGIDLYDCRVRSWYLHAATCPKNVVILLDTSGSMKGERMQIARSTVKAILNTLDDEDYVNILTFSDTVHYVDECFNNGTLMPANVINKRRLQERIDENVTTSMKADFELAFEEAFSLLYSESQRRPSTLCNKAILLITDGVPEHYEKVFRNWNWKYWPHNQTRVFTFLIGREVGDIREVKWIACANKGYYSHISTLADVQENVQNYIIVLSRPMVINRFENQIWTSVYLDHMTTLDKSQGLQLMTSFASPVFDTKNITMAEGNILGVMGTDIPIASLEELAPAYKIGVNSYGFIINNNGYVLLHPNYTPYRKDPKTQNTVLNPYYQNINFMEVVHPINADNEKEIKSLLERMQTNSCCSSELNMLSHYDNMKRMVKRLYFVQYKEIKNTKFSMGVAFTKLSFKPKTVNYGIPKTIVNELKKCLDKNNVEIAPWPYCKGLDLTLKGADRKSALLEALADPDDSMTYRQGMKQLVSEMVNDCRYVNKNILVKRWPKRPSLQNSTDLNDTVDQDTFESNGSYGVELIFYASVNGMTVYLTPDKKYSEYIANNTDPLAADYFKRAVEGAEDSRFPYDYTFSLDVNKEFNRSQSLVSVTAPIEAMKVVYGVSGMHMAYDSFFSVFEDILSDTGNCKGSDCLECYLAPNSTFSCHNYLIDNHGYIVASNLPDEHVNKFFGDVENAVMSDLINRSIFVGHKFIDHQANCDITAGSEKKKSRGASLLNPIKALFNGLLWAVTEVVILMSEFSLTSTWNSIFATPNEMTPEICKRFEEDYDYDTLALPEKEAFLQVSLQCTIERNSRKVIGHRPCHKTFMLYAADLSKIPRDRDKYGTIQECREGISHMCDYNDDSLYGPECAPVLDESYIVARVKNTNLLLVTTTNKCFTCPDDQPFDFRLDHREVNYTETEQCDSRRRRENLSTMPICHDKSDLEEDNECGNAVLHRPMIQLLVFCGIISHFLSLHV